MNVTDAWLSARWFSFRVSPTKKYKKSPLYHATNTVFFSSSFLIHFTPSMRIYRFLYNVWICMFDGSVAVGRNLWRFYVDIVCFRGRFPARYTMNHCWCMMSYDLCCDAWGNFASLGIFLQIIKKREPTHTTHKKDRKKIVEMQMANVLLYRPLSNWFNCSAWLHE